MAIHVLAARHGAVVVRGRIKKRKRPTTEIHNEGGTAMRRIFPTFEAGPKENELHAIFEILANRDAG